MSSAVPSLPGPVASSAAILQMKFNNTSRKKSWCFFSDLVGNLKVMATDNVSSQVTTGQPHLAKQDVSKLVNLKVYLFRFWVRVF